MAIPTPIAVLREAREATVNKATLQERFSRAMRKRAGRGCPFSRLDVADGVGGDVRTVEGWCDGRLPTLTFYYRLVDLFGPDFDSEVRGVADGLPRGPLRVYPLIEIRAARDALVSAIAKLDAIIGKPEIASLDQRRAG